MQIIKTLITFILFCCLIFHTLFVFANRVSKNPPAPHSNGEMQPSKDTSQGELSGDITFVSNYVSYGTSSTNNLPALQRTISYSLPSGLYASLWGSNSIIDGWKQSLELYPNIGWTGEKNEWSWYVYGAYDAYFFRPVGMNPSYFEFEGAIAHKSPNVKVKIGMTYSPNYYGNSGETFYPFFRLNIPLQNDYLLHMQLAYASIQDNDQYGVPDYGTMRLGIKKSDLFQHIDTALYFFATTIKKSQCYPEGPQMPPTINECRPGVYITLSRQFG